MREKGEREYQTVILTTSFDDGGMYERHYL